jgi:prophage antirepressor-like protein
MNELMNFEFENNENLECVELNGELLFNPYAVGKCLDISKTTVRDHISEMDEYERVLVKNSDVDSNNIRTLNNRGEVFLREPGFYQLVFKSRKPEAQKFVKWVTHDVLPSIRETGKYESKLENQNIVTRQLIDNMTRNLEQLTGVMAAELAITQHESWNKRLSNLMIDCSTRGLGTIRELYNELFYVFASETDIDIEDIAKLKGLKRMDYLRKHKELCKTVYEFAHKHFSSQDRQIVLISLDHDQQRLDRFVGGK